jgi:hypothetical protein
MAQAVKRALTCDTASRTAALLVLVFAVAGLVRDGRILFGAERNDGEVGDAQAAASNGGIKVNEVELRTTRATILLKRWSGRPGSNRRRPAWEAGILPLNYSRPRGLHGRLFDRLTHHQHIIMSRTRHTASPGSSGVSGERFEAVHSPA